MTDRTISLEAAIKVVQDNLAFSVKADIIKALSALPSADGWLDIADADGGLCQVTDGGYVVTAFRQDGHWIAGWQSGTMAVHFELSPTHYRPLPAPPQV